MFVNNERQEIIIIHQSHPDFCLDPSKVSFPFELDIGNDFQEFAFFYLHFKSNYKHYDNHPREIFGGARGGEKSHQSIISGV